LNKQVRDNHYIWRYWTLLQVRDNQHLWRYWTSKSEIISSYEDIEQASQR